MERVLQWKRGEYTISTDRTQIDVDAVAGYLANESYWAAASLETLSSVLCNTPSASRSGGGVPKSGLGGDPALQGLRRWILITRDAHGLYEQYGFQALGSPEGFMERRDPDVYTAAAGDAGAA